jgi:2-polyprenyl-3-methyl-5-hydroxy-6-metoxy-1,4-benzoquinol methylase
MLPDAPDFRHRAHLSELMDEPCSRAELQACLRDLAKVNHLFLAYRPVLRWLDSLKLQRVQGRICILDVGCGYGDGLRHVGQWARERKVTVELIGLDLNPDAISIAAEASSPEFEIEWVCANVFAYRPEKPVHLVMSSLFTHHLAEPDIVQFLVWMERHGQLGWFVNDLTRSAIPYYLFWVFARIARLHRFVQHDGPVSIARSFHEQDWRRMCDGAGLRKADFSIKAFAPARLCVAREKSR